MSDDGTFILDEFPKNGRIDNQLYKRMHTTEQFNLNFPNMQLQIIYNEKEYAELLKKLDNVFGPRPYTKAVCVATKDASWFYIDFLAHFKGKPSDFIGNLCLSYIEELIHSADPTKSETQIHEITCSASEGFLEMKLPDSLKEERLKYALSCDKLPNKKLLPYGLKK